MGRKKAKSRGRIQKYRALSIVGFCAGLLTFLLTYYFNENLLYQRFASQQYSDAIHALNEIYSTERLSKDSRGFTDLMNVLSGSLLTDNQIDHLQVGGSGLAMGRFTISTHTLWLFAKEDRKLGELTFQDDVLEKKITDQYLTAPLGKIKAVKALLQFIGAFIALTVLFIEAFFPVKK